MAKKIVVEFEAKGLDRVSRTVGDVVEETKSLKQQFREAAKEAQTLAGANIIDQKALDEAIARTAELKDRMNDVNEQVGVLTAGSKFEKMSNNLGDIGGKIASLDFEGANESASRLLNFSKSITFGDATKGIKDLGGTFLQLGKALLTNPLFLIAAVIAAIVYAIVKLLDKIGVLKVIMNALGKVFEWIMIPINAIIEGLKMFTDWLGITNNAAEDAAEKQAQSAEKLAEAYENKSARIIEGYDHEIKMAEINGESTRQAELKKAYFILNTAKQRAKADIARLKSAQLAGELDEKEIADLRKKAEASVTEANAAANDITELRAQFRAEDKSNREKADKEEKEAEEDKIKEATDRAKKASEDARKARQQALEDIRKAEKEYSDSLLTEQQREINAVNDKYSQLIKSAQKYNQDITTLTKAQNDAILSINSKYAKEEQQKLYEKNKEIGDAFAELQLTIETLENEHLDKLLSDQDREKNAIYDKYFALLEAARQNGIDTKLLEESQKAELDAIDANYAQKRKERELQDRVDKLDTHIANLELAQKFSNATNSLAEGVFALSNRLGKQDEKSREERAKRQFKINKALQLSTAVITGIQSVMQAFKNGMQNPIPLLGPATAAVYAGIAGVVSAANIAKIAATKFETTGGSASTGGGGGGPSAGGEVSTPQFNSNALFSTGGGSTQGITAGSQKENVATPVVKAVVVESDITNTQQRMSNIRQQATI